MTEATVTRCARCDSPIERGDLRCAVCAEVVPTAPEARGDVAVLLMRCAGCSAAVTFDPAAQGLACAFCSSVMYLETLADPLEETQVWLPFTVDHDAARAALRRWLSRLGWFRPSDLTRAARVEALRPLWWVAWTFDVEARVSWTADSDAGSGRAAWAPHAGRVDLRFDDILVCASRGLSDAEAAALAGRYDLASGATQPPEVAGATAVGTAGAVAPAVMEQFDVQRSAARRRILSEIDRAAADVVAEEHVPGTRQRKVKVASLLRGLETKRWALPAYVMAYRYKDELYRAVVCGQDAGCVTGRAPYSVAKIVVVVGVVLAGVGVVLAMVAGR